MAATLPRITARVDEETQSLLSQASALVGITNINSFVLNAAVEKARGIVEREQMLKLGKEDARMLVQALDAPAKSHPRLEQAAQQYHTKTQL